jgi:hypothetical protein
MKNIVGPLLVWALDVEFSTELVRFEIDVIGSKELRELVERVF